MKRRIVSILLAVLIVAAGISCGKAAKDTVNIYAPDGAPALALAYAISKDEEEDGVEYSVVNAQAVAAFVSNKDGEKNADICVLPVNLAAKLLGGGEKYRLLGVATHGNLFLLGDGEKITRENAALLKGKTVGVVQLANVPGLVTKAALFRLGIGFLNLTDGVSAEKVYLKAVEPLNDLKTLGVDYLVAGSPVAEGLGLPFAGSLQELYGEGKGYPQAVVVAKKELVEKKGEWLSGFLEALAFGGEWLKTASAEEIFAAYTKALDKELKPSFTQEKLTAQTIENAGVYFTSATESKEEIKRFLQDMTEIGAGAFTLADEFFYGEK